MKITLLTTITLLPFLLFSCGGNKGPSLIAQAKQRFELMDNKKDGRLSFDEYKNTPVAQASESPQTQFSQADSDGNGYLSKSELKSTISQFRKLANQ